MHSPVSFFSDDADISTCWLQSIFTARGIHTQALSSNITSCSWSSERFRSISYCRFPLRPAYYNKLYKFDHRLPRFSASVASCHFSYFTLSLESDTWTHKSTAAGRRVASIVPDELRANCCRNGCRVSRDRIPLLHWIILRVLVGQSVQSIDGLVLVLLPQRQTQYFFRWLRCLIPNISVVVHTNIRYHDRDEPCLSLLILSPDVRYAIKIYMIVDCIACKFFAKVATSSMSSVKSMPIIRILLENSVSTKQFSGT